MLFLVVAITLLHESKCAVTEYQEVTKGGQKSLKNINAMENVAQFGDAEHRGPRWYDYSESNDDVVSSLASEKSESISISKYSASDEGSSHAPSSETDEAKRATQRYRTCRACPHDMLKKYTNIGIKWICAGYQRARRSFKSDCMLRYRNCQDGTMFVKIYDHKCKKDPFHGRSWFYNYRV